MPLSSRQIRLTRAEQRQYYACAMEMKSEGVRIDLPQEWEDASCLIQMTIAPPGECEVFELASGGLRYVISVHLRSLARCLIEHVRITVPWDDEIELDFPDERYPIGFFGYPPFPRECILNSRIARTLKFQRAGDSVLGFILAAGVARFPPEHKTGQLVPFTLSLYDQYGMETVGRGHLLSQRCKRARSAVRARSEDLFGNVKPHVVTQERWTREFASDSERKSAEVVQG